MSEEYEYGIEELGEREPVEYLEDVKDICPANRKVAIEACRKLLAILEAPQPAGRSAADYNFEMDALEPGLNVV